MPSPTPTAAAMRAARKLPLLHPTFANKDKIMADAASIIDRETNLPALIAAAQAWLDWYDELERESDEHDPVSISRRKYHGKRIDALRASLAHVQGNK